MFQRRPRRFRRRSNGRGYQSRSNGGEHTRLGSVSITHPRGRNNFKTHQGAEKLVEKYKALAKEALSSGDKILSENYLQHADHFMRIIDSRNLNQQKEFKISENRDLKTTDSNPTKENNIDQTQATEEKKE